MSNPVLILITEQDLNKPESISRLTEWRIKNKAAYVGDYKVTQKSIKKWLKECVLEKRGRELFWILVEGEYIGHIGINHLKRGSVEIDNVARGSEKYKGSMTWALKIIIGLFRKPRTYLQVKPDNTHAIEFYKRNGFFETKRGDTYITMELQNYEN